MISYLFSAICTNSSIERSNTSAVTRIKPPLQNKDFVSHSERGSGDRRASEMSNSPWRNDDLHCHWSTCQWRPLPRDGDILVPYLDSLHLVQRRSESAVENRRYLSNLTFSRRFGMILSAFLKRLGEVNIRWVIFTSSKAIKNAPKGPKNPETIFSWIGSGCLQSEVLSIFPICHPTYVGKFRP